MFARSLFFVGLLLLAATSLYAQSAEETAVIETVQAVFDGINTKNTDLIRSVMTAEAILYSTSSDDGMPSHRFTSGEQFAVGIAGAEDEFHERMFEYEIQVREGVALVWANYDFHVAGKFSHCGVDTFSLVKTGGGWRVASLTYTVERTGCPERPPIPGSDE